MRKPVNVFDFYSLNSSDPPLKFAAPRPRPIRPIYKSTPGYDQTQKTLAPLH